MRSRVPTLKNHDEPEATVPTLQTMSDHHARHPEFAIGPQQMTVLKWGQDAAEAAQAIEPIEQPKVEVRLYKLQQVSKGGPFKAVVKQTIHRPKTHAVTAETKFSGKVDLTDGRLLDAFMRGDEDVKLRESDVVALFEAWATATQPTSEIASNAAKVMTGRIAVTRGVLLGLTDAMW